MNALVHHARCRRQVQVRLLDFLYANTFARMSPVTSRAWALVLSFLMFSQPALAETPVDERRDAEPDGRVEVINISGKVEVTGWDRDEIYVTGSLGRGVERLDFIVDGDETRIEVIYPRSGRSEGSELEIQIPVSSSLDVRTVSAAIKAADVNGRQWLSSVSGDVTSENYGSDLEAETVSGSIDVSAAGQPAVLSLKSVSGNIYAEDIRGELDAGSVSGRIEVDADVLNRARLGTTSGRISVDGSLASGGRYDLSTTSGRIIVNLDHDEDLDVDAQSFSGRIENCFGVEAEREGYSPQRSLRYRVGEGDRTVRIRTMSSRIEICADSLSG